MLLLVLLLIAPLTTLRAQESAGTAEVSAAGIELSGETLVIDLTMSQPVGVRTFNLTSPNRLVFDIEDAVLSLDEDALTSWASPMEGIASLDIAQFSMEPPVIRIVAEITGAGFETDRITGPDGVSLAIYRGTSPFEDTGPGAPPEHMIPTIEKLLHEIIDAGSDRFIIDFSFGVVLPQVKIESPTVLLLKFPGTDIVLPASDPANFATSVDGSQVSLMRAERIGAGPDMVTEIRLTVRNTSLLGYTLETNNDDTFELILFAEEPAVEIPETPVEPEPLQVVGGEMMVLASGDDVPVLPDAPIKIERVQFQAIDSDTDRFYIYYDGVEPEPRIQRFNYPTRIALYIPDSAVVLPESAEGRFDVAVRGVIAAELKVVNRVIEDVGPESQFVFYFPELDHESIGFTIDYVDPGLIHIDFYLASTPLEIESPVELNTSVDEGPAEPEEVAVPEPEVEVVEEIEISEPEEVAVPEPEVEIVEEIEIPEPEVIEEPVPVEVELPKLTVIAGEVIDNVIDFTIVASEPMPAPGWVDYHYPERIGLRFPLADVQLLDADPGTCSAYTHIRKIPLVRAIIKDRPDEQHTTIIFTLEGYIEEYGRELSSSGNELRISFVYNPVTEIEPPAVIEPEPVVIEEPELVVIEEPELVVIEEPEPEPVVIEEPEPVVIEEPEPVVVEEPELVVIEEPEPEPVVIEEPEPVVVEEPEPVVVEEPAPVVEEIEEIEEIEVPGTPAAPGAPPFSAPEPAPELPLIIVDLANTADDLVTFTIRTSETLPVPDWVEYRYPDRLGLRFPLANVELMGERETFTVRTNVAVIPMVRTIVKDQAGEQYTTVTFTLGGSLDEFDGELDWNGNEMNVAFRYEPVVIELEPEIVPEPVAIEEAPPPVEEQTPVAVEEAPPVEEQTPVVVEVEVEAIQEETSEESFVIEEVVLEPEPEEAPMLAEAQPIEEEEISVETIESSEEISLSAFIGRAVEVDESDEFGGVLITGIEFETVNGADVIYLATDGYLEGWEVQPLNFPTKLVVRLPESRPVYQNGDSQRFDERVDGAVVDQYVATGSISQDYSFTTLTIYAHEVESTVDLGYDVRVNDGVWKIAVFRRDGASPFGYEPTPVQMVDEEEPEIAIPEIRSVREFIEPEIDEEITPEEIIENEPKLSMTLEDANIRDVLHLISQQAGLNILIDNSVQGKITISLTDVPLFELLDLLGAQMDFTYVVRSGVYIFGESSTLQKDWNTWPRWYISLSYADPDQLRGILVSMQVLGNDQIMIYRGAVGGAGGTSIAQTVMILQGEIQDMERAYQIICAVDQPPVMVQVEFQILNTSITDNENFGFQFNFGTGTGTTNLYFSEQVSADPDMGPFTQGFDRLRAGNQNVYSINYVINYLLEEGYAELLNRSTLTVANNQQGSLFVGETIPYRSTYQVSELGRVTQRVANQTVGLTLNFRPHANPDGTVTMFLTPSNSNLLELTDIGPRTVDQRFSTTVRVKDGEPFIIGGFIRDEQRVNYDRFPFLSELPLLGHLFRNRETKKTKSELIFVCTPHIIKPSMHLPEIWTDEDFQVPLPISGDRY